jgi:hypothetical protein
MAIKQPIALYSGEQKQLVSGDTLPIFALQAVSFSAVVEGAVAAGAPVALKDSAVSGSARAVEADANGAGTLPNVVGIAPAAIADTATGIVQLAGEVDVPDARWDAVPAVTDVGKPVYLSENVGKVTLTAPLGSGSTVLKIGLVSRGGAGAVRMVIQIGEASVLA